jgi:hydrocephalus-inducing protein
LEKKELLVRFCPTEVGTSVTNLKFALSGSDQLFHLPCIGNCQYPQIITDYKKIFSRWKKIKDEHIVNIGEYVPSTKTFDFGPLLSSKSREKYLERYPENRATVLIKNAGTFELKADLFLKADLKTDIFFFEPSSIELLPGQSQQISIWAYPKTNNHFEDTFIICIRDNPEPFTFKLACTGVKPDLEVDKKFFNFDKILIGRSEKREIKLKNPTLLPISVRIMGAEALGDDFTIYPLEIQIPRFGEASIITEFRAIKTSLIKRVIRLELSDGDKIGDTVQDIPILITAESYDISMDIHFPKGVEGALDFGIIKVMEEGKQMAVLKNKGKYEVGYRFLFDNPSTGELFAIHPTQGIMQPAEKPFTVQLIFKATKELFLKDDVSLRCVVFEPSTGEVTASIPIKISAVAVFSKFAVLPSRDLNFRSLVQGTKAIKQFSIENLGNFDFKYSIYKLLARETETIPSFVQTRRTGESRKGQKPRAGSPGLDRGANKVVKDRKEVTGKKEQSTDILAFGVFNVFPITGVVQSNTKLPITVEFLAESPGLFEELIGIDVSERSPADIEVLEYRLVGESCIPGINTTDFTSIFEEHRYIKF